MDGFFVAKFKKFASTFASVEVGKEDNTSGNIKEEPQFDEEEDNEIIKGRVKFIRM
jgi:hypothetical protein